MRLGPFALVGSTLLAPLQLPAPAMPSAEAFAIPACDGALLASTEPPRDVSALLDLYAPGLDAEEHPRVAEAVRTESERAGYDPLFVLALMRIESHGRLHRVSRRGARGLMQIRPATEAWLIGHERDLREAPLGADDPALDVRLAIRYVRRLERRFRSRELALMAYNIGPNRVAHRLLRGDVPSHWREYPHKVEAEYQRLRRTHALG